MTHVATDILDEGAIVLIHFTAEHTVQDYIALIDAVLIPHARQHPALTVHMVHDMREVKWNFPDFMTYIRSVQNRRRDDPPPANVRHHFVGASPWLNNWRTYMMTHYQLETTAFKTIDDALMYIRDR